MVTTCKKIFVALVLVLPLAITVAALPAHAQQLPDFTGLVEQEGPMVVNISTTQKIKHPSISQQMPNMDPNDPFYQFFKHFMPNMPDQGDGDDGDDGDGGGGSTPNEIESTSLGSGFIISSDGYILTNAHVVEGADEVTVKLVDKREFKAKIIGEDKRTDIALIKINATGLSTVKFGDPDKLKVGEWVIAIGSPFGFENSVTAGIVSAKGRSLPDETLVPFIQTDVAVNPGNSGGPLINLKGEVVGINSQIYSRTGGYMGLSFAIPIDVANDVVEQIKTNGKVTRGRIGVVIQPVTRELAESFGLSAPTGALVNSVEKGSPADKAGVLSGDIITKFDGKTVESSDQLPRIVSATKPGNKVAMDVLRNKETKTLTVTVGEMPTDDGNVQAAETPAPKKSGKKVPEAISKLGLSLSDLTAQQRSQLKVDGGVLVENAQGAAARANLRTGDVILGVNNQDVKSVDQFAQLLAPLKKGDVVALLVRRAGNSLFVPLRIE